MDKLAVHRVELERATTDDPRVVLPTVPAGCRRILDVGSGAGQVLVGLRLPDEIERHAVDHESPGLRLGREWDRRTTFVCATGEALPYRDGYFDFVVSRNALPYTHLPSSLSEIGRVLRPQGRLWMTLYPPSMVWSDLAGALQRPHPRRVSFQLYRLMNGTLFHTTGRLVRIPIGRRRCESFQTDRAVTRALGQASFGDIRIQHGRFFIVTATKEG